VSNIWTLIDEIDQDGAVRETAAEVKADTRAGFLKKAGVGAGAAIGGSAVIGVALPGVDR
jgi:hypothetical protein